MVSGGPDGGRDATSANRDSIIVSGQCDKREKCWFSFLTKSKLLGQVGGHEGRRCVLLWLQTFSREPSTRVCSYTTVTKPLLRNTPVTHSFPLVSVRGWFQNLLWITKSVDAQVPSPLVLSWVLISVEHCAPQTPSQHLLAKNLAWDSKIPTVINIIGRH